MNKTIMLYVYDSRSTMNPVQGMNVLLQKDDEGFSVDSVTNNEGEIVFNWETSGIYRITLDNDPTWIFEYVITESKHTFTYYEDERGIV